MDKVTIVTVTHDARRFVELCVKATHLRTKENHTHVIIDNGSTDGTLQMLRQFAEANMIKLYERKLRKNAAGHALSLNWYLYDILPDTNLVCLLDSTNLVCLLDSDAYPTKEGWLTKLFNHMESGKADATGFPHFRDEKLLHPACMLFKHDKLIHAGKPNWRINKMNGVFNDTGMTACNAMIRYGSVLAPLPEHEMKDICTHRWSGTRMEVAKDGVLDGHIPRKEFDKISDEWFDKDSAKL